MSGMAHVEARGLGRNHEVEAVEVERPGRRVAREDAAEARLVARECDALDGATRFGDGALEPVGENLRAAATVGWGTRPGRPSSALRGRGVTP